VTPAGQDATTATSEPPAHVGAVTEDDTPDVTPATGDVTPSGAPSPPTVTPVTDLTEPVWTVPDDLSTLQVNGHVTGVTDTRAAIAAMRDADPDLTGAEIARRLGVTRQTVARHLKTITD
jgi:DNA-binding transcriptional ArsR family regulator